MKANELMIGDWVRCTALPEYGEFYRIAEIGGIVCIDGERELFSALDEIEPIPITGKILKRNGFKYDELDGDFSWQKGHNITGISEEVRLVQDGPEWFCYLFGPNVDMEIEELHLGYIHELQHAMRLIGIEKEITKIQ